jgi:hypothetical protein
MCKLPPKCGGVFVYSCRLGVIYDFQATNMSLAGEVGLSQGVLPASNWLPGVQIWVPAIRLCNFLSPSGLGLTVKLLLGQGTCSRQKSEWVHGPWGKWGQLREGGDGGGGPPSEEQISSWSAAVEEVRPAWGNQEDSNTGPMRHQEPTTHRVCSIVN